MCNCGRAHTGDHTHSVEHNKHFRDMTPHEQLVVLYEARGYTHEEAEYEASKFERADDNTEAPSVSR